MAGTENDDRGAQLQDIKEGLAGYAKDKADAARDQASTLIEEHKGAAADELTDVSEALRQASEHLRTRSRSMIAGLAQTTADQLESLAGSLRERDLGELIEDAHQVARRQPELFFAGTLVVGFLFARALRSQTRARRPGPNSTRLVPTQTAGV